MRYSENEARVKVIEAGHLLLEKKLIARTWGNISARISEEEFIITPSGRAYDTLSPDELVKVRIDDLSYGGSIKPSSEKGIHASVYALRGDVDFIVHTHQFYASVICADCEDTEFAPCAGYGLPGTKKLRENVAACVSTNPDFNSFLMARHGALCFGGNMQEAFSEADRLEANCRSLFDRSVSYVKAYASSDTRFGIERKYAAAVRNDDDYVMAVSTYAKRLRPYLDDFAQIVGTEIKCVLPGKDTIVEALKGRNAVLLRNEGALCVADNVDDADAVSMILEKNCAAALYVCRTRPIGFIDAALQRAVYLAKYSRLKGK